MYKKYDIFISYRREGGYETAKHLYDLLTRDGYKVSFDLDTLRNGDFDTELLSRIEQCKDFILIVNSNAFERTLDPDFPKEKDWLRCELAYALKTKKNIIPIFLAGTNGFPEGLPSDVAAVVKKNGPQYNRYYFDDFFVRLKKDFLISKPSKKNKRIIINSVIIGLLILIFSMFVPYFLDMFSDNQDKVLSNEVIEANEGITFFTDYNKLYVGDYVYEDGSFSHRLSNDREACGIVVSLKTTAEEIKNGWTHGWIMALYDANEGKPVQWAKHSGKHDYNFFNYDANNLRLLMSDTQGYLYSYVYVDDTSDYSAIAAARNYSPRIKNSSGWYLPTLAQWQYIFNVMGGSKISFYNNELSYSPEFSDNNFDTFHFLHSYYWTSSLESDERAWVIYLGDGDKKDYLNRTKECYVRALTAI